SRVPPFDDIGSGDSINELKWAKISRVVSRLISSSLKRSSVAVSFLPVSNEVERGRDESTRRARAPGAALVRQAPDRSHDHPPGTAPTGRFPRASSAAAAKGYAGDTG